MMDDIKYLNMAMGKPGAIDNGDGTYTHVFAQSTPLDPEWQGALEKVEITFEFRPNNATPSVVTGTIRGPKDEAVFVAQRLQQVLADAEKRDEGRRV